MAIYLEKDGITFEARDGLDAARLKHAGYKEVKLAAEPKAEAEPKPEKAPAEANAEAVEKVNKKGGK
jgi:hypothetical protein